MANVIEEIDGASVVVNFSTVLLNQITGYSQQFKVFFTEHKPFHDQLLLALSQEQIPDQVTKTYIRTQCIRANEKNLIQRYSAYSQLVKLLSQTDHPEYLSDQFYYDLLVWYQLAWIGETVKQHNPIVKNLIEKEYNYTYQDRVTLLGELQVIIDSIIPKYKNLATANKIELAFTPDNHPILPLLINFDSTLEAMPEAPLPNEKYPEGQLRAKEHIQNGLQTFEENFSHRPLGCWPSEGSLCSTTLGLLEDAGIRWTASGGGVLKNSLVKNNKEDVCVHHAFKFDNRDITCFFRDDNLSDMIGFTYHDWNADDAVNNLIHHITNIRNACNSAADSIVPIILDGENCWEHYPANGYYFLTQLYQKLCEHPDINLTTFMSYLNEHHAPTVLETIQAGSWVYGNFATWIGCPDKNKGWDYLIQAKKDFDEHIDKLDSGNRKKAEQQLAICEASDWFWWFGDYNAAESVYDFDKLFRDHLKDLYRFLKLAPPAYLDTIISAGNTNLTDNGGVPEGAMRKANA